MYIRTGHLRRRTELGGDDLQTAFHLRVIGQILGHICVDIHMEYHHNADGSQYNGQGE